jgi:hypothetical protein
MSQHDLEHHQQPSARHLAAATDTERRLGRRRRESQAADGAEAATPARPALPSASVAGTAVEVADAALQRRHADHLERVDERCLGGVLLRDHQAAHPRRPRQRAMGRTPVTGRTDPSSASSPMNAWPSSRMERPRQRMAMAMGRANAVPSLGISAGARLTVRRRMGKSKPAFRIDARTRSRAS